MNVYEKAEAYIRKRLAGRRILENCVKLGDYIARKHGPHLRVFAIPSEALAEDEAFARRVGLSRSQIRTATEALIEIGFINRISPERTERRKKDRPVRYELGDEIAALFPAAEIASCKTQGVIIIAPLREATWKNPIPRPVRALPARPDKAFSASRLEALARLEAQKARPLPMLSQAALMAGRLGQSLGSRMQRETASNSQRARDGSGLSPGLPSHPSTTRLGGA